MEISVIIPCYNIVGRLHILRQALESILQQTRPCDEILIVDDGSSDGSQQEIEALIKELDVASPAIKLCAQEKNGGVSLARNAGILAAQGRYIAFLDFDDLYLPDFLKEALSAFEEDDTRKAVFTMAYFYREYKGLERAHSGEGGERLNELPYKLFLADLLKTNFPNPMGSSVICKREIFTEHKELIFDSFLSKRTAEDVHFGYNLLVHGIRPYFVDKPLVVHRTNFQYVSRSYGAFLSMDELEVFDYIYNTTMQPLLDHLKKDTAELFSEVTAALDRKRDYFFVKSFFLKGRYLESCIYLLRSPRSLKSWFNHLVVRLSFLPPLSLLRPWYSFLRSPKSTDSLEQLREKLSYVFASRISH